MVHNYVNFPTKKIGKCLSEMIKHLSTQKEY